jgi:hypothetical protein
MQRRVAITKVMATCKAFEQAMITPKGPSNRGTTEAANLRRHDHSCTRSTAMSTLPASAFRDEQVIHLVLLMTDWCSLDTMGLVWEPLREGPPPSNLETGLPVFLTGPWRMECRMRRWSYVSWPLHAAQRAHVNASHRQCCSSSTTFEGESIL